MSFSCISKFKFPGNKIKVFLIRLIKMRTLFLYFISFLSDHKICIFWVVVVACNNREPSSFSHSNVIFGVGDNQCRNCFYWLSLLGQGFWRILCEILKYLNRLIFVTKIIVDSAFNICNQYLGYATSVTLLPF